MIKQHTIIYRLESRRAVENLGRVRRPGTFRRSLTSPEIHVSDILTLQSPSYNSLPKTNSR